MIELMKGDVEYIYCTGWDDHAGANVTITTAVFEVFDSGHNSIQAEDTATIEDNGTETPDVKGLVDTGQDAFTSGSFYVRFTITISSEVLKHDIWFNLKGAPVSEPILSDFAALDERYVSLGGDTMTGLLTLSGAPTANLHASTKKYVDDELAFKADDADVLKKDGTVALTADWDIGDARMIQTDKVRARDGAGLSLFEDGGAGIFIKDGGNVGIGMIDPIAKLDIVHAGGSPSGSPLFTARFCQGSGSPGFIFEKTDVGRFISFWSGTTGAVLGFASELDRLAIGNYSYANRYSANFPSPEIMSLVSSTASVGIGTTTPDRKLDVLHSSGPQLRLTHTDNSIYAELQADGNGILTITPTGSIVKITGNAYPGADDTYYLGKNDDDSPAAWKGVICKDTTNGKYYRIEVINGVITATDLTD